MHFRVLPTSDYRYRRLEKIYNDFAKSPILRECNFYFNGDINIVDSKDLVFSFLGNGTLFASTGLLDLLDDTEISYLFIHELCHQYLRTTVKCLKYSDFFKLVNLDRKDYRTNRDAEFEFLKKLYFLKIQRKQEEKAIVLWTTFLSILKADSHVEPDRVIQDHRIELLNKMKNYDRVYHPNKKWNEKPLENYFRRHHELWKD